MKGKKLMAMLMAGSLLLAGLTGCGGAKCEGRRCCGKCG